MPEKVVLAYSGGLDTSIIIPWLKENYAYDVIAMVADVGQGDDVEAVVEEGDKTGASKVVVEDLREEVLTGYVFPALKAGAVYEHKYLLGTSMARPVIAKHQVEVALREGATAVSHGCTGKGNDQVRFELTYQALSPELKVIAPWREWNLKSREDCLDYAEAHGIQVSASREKIHSRDRNLWHISHEGGELEDAANAPFESTRKEVTGTVTLSLYKGNVSVLSRKSDYSLYRTDLSSFTMGESYDQKDAAGFIRILGLPSRSRALTRGEKQKHLTAEAAQKA